jgi:hypothetical protein
MNKYSIELKWAAVFTAMTLAWMVLERAAGLHDEHLGLHATLTNLIAIPAVAVYVVALREKRARSYGGAMTYGQGFVSGAVVTLIVTVATPLSQYIISTVITPDYFANAIRYTVEHNMLTQEAAEAQFNLTNYVVQATIFAPVMGLLTSAIVAVFTRSRGASA